MLLLFKCRRHLLPLLGVCFLICSASLSYADDWGTSTNVLFKKNLKHHWFLLSRSNLATRNDNEQIFLGYTGVSLGYQITNQVSSRVGYRIARFRIGEHWQTERRPMTELYVTRWVHGWRFTSRSRAELRQPDWKEDDVRLRQEFTFTAPWRLTRLGLQPFAEEELFYSTDKDQFEAYWATVGLSFKPKKGVKFKTAYRYNRVRIQGVLQTRHVLVTGFNFFF